MTQREKVLGEKRHVSSKLSELIRYIAFGLIAACYLIFSSSSEFASKMMDSHKLLLILTTIFAVITILFDYLQFLGGFYSVEKALKNSEGNYYYSRSAFSYRLRNSMFFAKQITLLYGIITFLIVILLELR